MSTSFAAGVLAYMLATFNGGYLWHRVLFNEMYRSLKVWTRFPEDIGLQLGASAVLLQALLVAYMLPIFQRATGRSGTLSGALFGLWVRTNCGIRAGRSRREVMLVPDRMGERRRSEGHR
ncbi:unnamed protein product [Ectocarpus fasciculatus]